LLGRAGSSRHVLIAVVVAVVAAISVLLVSAGLVLDEVRRGIRVINLALKQALNTGDLLSITF
jgi:hypothetical protein